MVERKRRVAVVTGGTQGIGRATAQAFAKDGWNVAVLGRGEARLRSTEAELAGMGATARGLKVDVAHADEVDAAAARIESDLGEITVWVNNAMATVIAPLDKVSADEFRRVTDVTYHGVVFGTLAALRYMRLRNRGHIIQVSSVLAIRSAPLQAAYCGAKRAVTGFTDALRAELLHEGVDVALTIVYLPTVNTPQFERQRNHTGQAQNAPGPVYDPRLCADAIVSAARTPVRDVWVGRSVLEAATAQALVPNVADQQAAKMWDAQLRAGPPSAAEGNLFEPALGDPGIDGPFGDRVTTGRGEIFTSRARDAAEIGLGKIADLLLSGADMMKKRSPRV